MRSPICTGTILIQHEYYKELKKGQGKARDIEGDALTLDEEEKHYE